MSEIIEDKIDGLTDETAKRDFVICQNDFYFEIKRGDSLDKVPVKYHDNLKTEGVI